jgi:hypothetical protein
MLEHIKCGVEMPLSFRPPPPTEQALGVTKLGARGLKRSRHLAVKRERLFEGSRILGMCKPSTTRSSGLCADPLSPFHLFCKLGEGRGRTLSIANPYVRLDQVWRPLNYSGFFNRGLPAVPRDTLQMLDGLRRLSHSNMEQAKRGIRIVENRPKPELPAVEQR